MKDLRLHLVVLALTVLATNSALAAIIVASTGTTLARFDSSSPGSVTLVPITGLGAGEAVVGLDFRPANRLVYLVSKDGTSVGRLYTVDPTSGAATLVATLAADPADLTNPFTALSGTSFGADFNPVADRLRIVSDTGQNLRVNPANGLVTTDASLNGGALTSTAAAYANNFAGTASTTLYDIDPASDALYVQNPPNNGTLTLIGSLGVNTGSQIGFDIDRLQTSGYAAMAVGGVSGLYSINLTTGASTLIGTIGTGTTLYESLAVVDDVSFSSSSYGVAENGTATITLTRLGSTGTVTVDFSTSNGSASAGSDYIDSDQTVTFNPGVTTQTVTVPIVNDAVAEGTETVLLSLSNPTGGTSIGTPSTATLSIADDDGAGRLAVAITGTGQLIQFYTTAPSVITNASSVTGLQPAETLLGIDFRPADGALYGLGSSGRLYTINIATGVATLVGTLSADPADATSPFAGLSGTSFGFDFNPVADRIRITTDADQNLRVNPSNALVTTDANLNPGAPDVVGSAYTNSFAGAVATTLYDIDSTTDTLLIQNPPNNGTLTAVGALGIDTSANVGFDITPDNSAFATLTSASSSLYAIDLTTGAATLVGAIGTTPATVTAFAIVPSGTFAFSSGTYTVPESAGTATITVNRIGGSQGTASVTVTTSDGTAVAPGDYTATNVVLTFGPGVTSATASIPITNDLLNETNETVNLALSNPTGGAMIGTPATAVLTINDDDAAPTLSINDVTVTEGASGTVNATFTVSLSAASGQTVTVTAATADGTAQAGSDYNASGPMVLTFNPGQLTQTFTVTVNGDALVEPDETFNVDLSAPTNASIADGQGVGTITNDDVPGITIDDVTAAEGAAATFTVTLSSASPQTVTVTATTANGSAIAGSDYVATGPQVITFAPGVLTQTFTVSGIDDAVDEADETYFVDLTAPANATITDSQGLGTITDDDATPAIRIDDVSVTEGTSGTTTTTFTVSLSASSSQTITVDAATADGTATAGSDYVAAGPLTLTFAPGVVTQTFDVTVNGDATGEPDETFLVNLSAPTNATITDGQAVGTIISDDAAAIPTLNQLALFALLLGLAILGAAASGARM